MKKTIMLVAIMLATGIGTAQAKAFPRAVPEDARVRVIKFDPNNVTELSTSFGFATTVEFGSEQIQTVIAGDSIGWQMIPQGNRLTIKPAEKAVRGMATTNITVITDKRNYYFHVRNVPRSRPMFIVRFDYSGIGKNSQPELTAALESPEFRQNNYNYQASSKGDIGLQSVFDDGQFTFFEFDPKQPLPAIFMVNADGREELTNSRKEGKYVVVEKIGKGFSLRLGKQVKCIKNLGMRAQKSTGEQYRTIKRSES